MPIPTYDDWKTTTARGVFTPRSKQLEAVDKALKAYNLSKTDPNKATLKAALNAWIAYKGANWKTSTRNAPPRKIVEELYSALNPYRTAAPAWTAPPLPPNPVPGQIYLGQSFEFSNSLARTQVPQAFGRAKQLIHAAYLGINQARMAAGQERTIYQRWFGAYDAARFKTVNDNIKALHDALWNKAVVLYYRGMGVSGPTDCPAENGTLAPEAFFGAAWRPQHLPGVLNRNYTYIFLGREFFNAGVYQTDSTGGVIIHELTHAICGTDDVVYNGHVTYGPDLCKALAIARPDLAVTNADSYEYLCENYQNRLYQPKPMALNLPPKASVSLDMRAPV